MRLVLLAVTSFIGAVVVAAPGALTMIPSRAHTARELEWAHAIVTWTPLVLAVLAPVALFIGFSLLFRPPPSPRPRLARGLTAALLVVLGAATWFSLARPAENVFAPITNVHLVPAEAADFLEDEDMVLGVRIDGASRAYPVGQLVYHHIVNDVVAGEPIVATF